MKRLDSAFDAWKTTPTKALSAQLLTAANPIMDKAMTSYAGRQGPVLKARAKLLALNTFKAYDPKKGAKLSTYLMTQLQPLRRVGLQTGQAVHVPEGLTYDKSSVTKSRKAFQATFGREPSDHELADDTGLSIARIRRVGEVPTVVSGTQAEGEGYGPGVLRSTAEDNWLEFVYYELLPTDKLILDHRLGRHGKAKLSNNEIAVRTKMTPSAVTQRMAKIVARLQEGEGLNL